MMVPRTTLPLLCAAFVLAAATPAAAQQRIDRFPETASSAPIEVPAALVASEGRSSYWLEGVALGVVAGVLTGVLTIEGGGDCPLDPGYSCSDDYTPVLFGSTLLAIGGGFLGGMIGASIPRERGGEER